MLPGQRKKERTWKDEVRDRVRDRKRVRGGPDLPLFKEDDTAVERTPSDSEASAEPAAVTPSDAASEVHLSRGGPAVEGADEEQSTRGAGHMELGDSPELPASRAPQMDLDVAVALARVGAVPRTGTEAADEWPLHPGSASSTAADGVFPGDRSSAGDEWPLELRDASAEAPPVERPAQAMERVQAAAVDLVILVLLGAVVVYFASQVAHLSVLGLLPAWRYLVAYLCLLALGYATYFTGTTGQTPGKMLGGLRVVTTAGRAPSYPRAGLRAILGALGILAAGLGLVSVLLDPARRAFHDRMLRTRVVRR